MNKIAIVHDGIYCKGGAERVLLQFHQAFPNAPIYTSILDIENTYIEFNKCDIRVTWFNKIAKNEKQFKRLFFPFCIYAMGNLDLTEYDIIIISSTHCAKYIKFSEDALVIAYCYTPFRLAWDPHSYIQYNSSKYFKKKLFDIFIKILRTIDYKYSSRIRNYIAMTVPLKQKISRAYSLNKEKIVVIPPSININKYKLSQKKCNYFLVVSRLEAYKKVDLVVDCFNKINEELIVVGKGTQKDYLQKISKRNIRYLENIDDEKLNKLYSEAQSLIFPQVEDFGLTPLEANACGTPVIAFSKGGILETMVPFDGSNESTCTALFFHEQSVASLEEAIHKSKVINFNKNFIRKNAEKFSDEEFIKKIISVVKEKSHN